MVFQRLSQFRYRTVYNRPLTRSSSSSTISYVFITVPVVYSSQHISGLVAIFNMTIEATTSKPGPGISEWDGERLEEALLQLDELHVQVWLLLRALPLAAQRFRCSGVALLSHC